MKKDISGCGNHGCDARDLTDGHSGEWSFYEYEHGRWTWQSVTPEACTHSAQAFESWIETIADAIEHGFSAGDSNIVFEGKSRRAHPRLRRADATRRN
jgi:hypothetical protein